jgi:Cytochrome c7 and related cytochrome c/Doubled CXXCH motif (Paired_CXXCH_1)
VSDKHNEHSSRPRLPWRPLLILPVAAAGLFALIAIALFMSQPSGPQPEVETGEISRVDTVNPFLSCGDCHDDLDASLKADPNPLLLFRHGKHFRTGVSDCAQCHVANTHTPDKTRVPRMITCAKCHQKGPDEEARAPGTCQTCHPPGVSQAPPSHTLEEWAPKAHAERARTTAGFDCLQCHSETTCESCHGLQMPHPQTWAEQPHVRSYFDDPKLCARCHELPAAHEQDGRDTCDSCHHPQGQQDQNWIQAHPDVIRSRGATSCFQCHAEETCATCHSTGMFDLSADRPLALEGSTSTTGSADPG